MKMKKKGDVKMEEKKINDVSINGFGVASLVTGIISLLTIEFIIISVALGILAVIFGLLGLRKPNKGMAKAGLTLGIVSLLVTFLLFLFLEVLDVSLFTIPSWYK